MARLQTYVSAHVHPPCEISFFQKNGAALLRFFIEDQIRFIVVFPGRFQHCRRFITEDLFSLHHVLDIKGTRISTVSTATVRMELLTSPRAIALGL